MRHNFECGISPEKMWGQSGWQKVKFKQILVRSKGTQRRGPRDGTPIGTSLKSNLNRNDNFHDNFTSSNLLIHIYVRGFEYQNNTNSRTEHPRLQWTGILFRTYNTSLRAARWPRWWAIVYASAIENMYWSIVLCAFFGSYRTVLARLRPPNSSNIFSQSINRKRKNRRSSINLINFFKIHLPFYIF